MATAFEVLSGNAEFSAGQGVADTSSPVFSGIQSVTAQSDGSFLVAWNSATGTKTPIRYEIYAAIGSIGAAALFLTANRVAFSPSTLTQWRITTLRDQTTYFINGQIYTFGIRAVDAFNYEETNTVILTSTAIASGNIGGVFQTQVSLLTTQVSNITTSASSLFSSATSLASSASSISSSASSLSSSASSLFSSATSLASSASGIATTAASLASTSSALSITSGALSTNVSTFSSQLSTMTGYLSSLNVLVNTNLNDLVNTVLAGQLVTLAADLVTLGNDLTTFSTQNGILTTEVSQLAGLITALGNVSTGLAGSGGLKMTTETNSVVMTTTC